MKFGVTRTNKFFIDNKIAQAVYKSLLHQIGREIMLLLVNNVHEKIYHKESKQKEFRKGVHPSCDLVVCYVRMLSFSANQKLVIFACTLLQNWNRFFIL